MTYKICFPPVVDEETRVVILGSLPGDASLQAGQYYAHPRNQFWRLLADCLHIPLVAQPYWQRLEILRQHRVGLWDVVAHARRRGSLDTALRDVKHNDLVSLFLLLPNLQLIAFNGRTAWLATRQMAKLPFTLLQLPSSSPAYTLPYHIKLDQWKTIIGYL